jgi:hypothetical protein
MTWDEFKKIVDDKLAEADKDGSEEICYIGIGINPSFEIRIDPVVGIKIY